MFRIFALAAALTFASPVMAQEHSEDHQHDHQHGHSGHDHDHDVPVNADIQAALAEGGSLVTVDVLGVVCDFCATAMSKTFGRREEVAAVYVDLDTKVLSLVLNNGSVMDDATIEDLVKKAGYKTSAIHRADEAEADDAS